MHVCMRHDQTSARRERPLGTRGTRPHPPNRDSRRTIAAIVVAPLLLLTTSCGPVDEAARPTLTDCRGGDCATPTPAMTRDAVNRSPAPSATPAATLIAGATPSGPLETPPAAAPPVSSPIAFQTEGVSLGPVLWATAIDPETRAPRTFVSSIAADTRTIYAVVAVKRITAGTAMSAQWSYNRTRLESFDRVVVAGSTQEETWIEFHLALTQPGTWPLGTYDVSIAVNGDPALTSSVEVENAGL